MTLSDIPVLNEILTELLATYSGDVVSVYGIGSFFDDQLPSDWIKNDIDLIVVVNTLENLEIPKRDFTDARFKNYPFSEYKVSLGFNTITGLQNKDVFQKESYANYEWGMLDLKIPANSVHLAGKDVRSFLPELSTLVYDYDDILARSMYHLERSLKLEYPSVNIEESKKAFTKAVFKFCFYLCLLFGKEFKSTSIKLISVTLENLIQKKIVDNLIMSFLKESILYRRGIKFKTEYPEIRNKFIWYLFSMMGKGILHRRMRFHELISYLESTYRGLNYLKKSAYNIRESYYRKKSKKKE